MGAVQWGRGVPLKPPRPSQNFAFQKNKRRNKVPPPHQHITEFHMLGWAGCGYTLTNQLSAARFDSRYRLPWLPRCTGTLWPQGVSRSPGSGRASPALSCSLGYRVPARRTGWGGGAPGAECCHQIYASAVPPAPGGSYRREETRPAIIIQNKGLNDSSHIRAFHTAALPILHGPRETSILIRKFLDINVGTVKTPQHVV